MDQQERGADLILNGHAHVYERFAPQAPNGAPDPAFGIRQIVVGTGGYGALYEFTHAQANSEARFNDSHGVIKLTLHPTRYDWQFLPILGNTSTDSGSADCHGAPMGPPPPPPATACSDGADNDGDGRVDYPADPGCSSSTDTDETDLPACSDQADNDGDAKVDYPADPGCSSPTDTDEADPPPPPPGTVPSVRSTSFATANGPSSSLVIPKPSGTAAGDLLLAIVAHQGGVNKNMTAPAGWSAVPNTDWAQGNNSRIHAWYRIADGSEPTSFTFGLIGGGDDMSGGILAIQNASQGAPINAAGGQSNGATASTTVAAPSITTTLPNTLLVFGASCASAARFTPPAGMSERWDAASSGTYKIGTEAATQVASTAGPTGPRAAIASSSCKSVGILVAVAPG